ncbi:MAG: glycosyltransferase family 39 protein [Elusimicrobia bacterium]|nr:glycosyltransferase family 39 protein [Elusimicrobiota bacterium]
MGKYAGFDRAGLALAGAVAAAALGLRLWGIGWGFPGLFNGDEGHHVNMAVALGRGTLNPGVFKYPSLWFYTLFGAFGLFFLAWSGLGLRHSVREFGQLFVWRPERFYLTARLVSAAFSVLALERVWSAGRELGSARLGMWAAGLLAVSLPLVEQAHAAKPDSLLFFWSACAWAAALRYFVTGRPRALLAAGVLTGLAVSTQYTAAPLVAAPATAWLVRRLVPDGRQRPSWGLGLSAAALIPAAFLAGSPFILLDHAAFARDMADHATLNFARAPAGWHSFANAFTFAGPWWLCGALVAAGAAALLRRDRPLAAMLLAPPVAQMSFLAFSDKGGAARYLIASLPALALVAAHGVEALGGARLAGAAARAAVLALIMFPGGLRSAAYAAALNRPDTRLAAQTWIEANLPIGTRIVLGAEPDTPPLRSSREQVARLLERTRAAGHPRARYYELMLESHPGGGYDLLRMKRDAGDMDTGPWHRQWSDASRDTLDVAAGLSAARAAGASVAVLSSMGLGFGTPDVGRFLDETERQGRLLAEFLPEEGRVNGPHIKVYRIDEGAR